MTHVRLTALSKVFFVFTYPSPSIRYQSTLTVLVIHFIIVIILPVNILITFFFSVFVVSISVLFSFIFIAVIGMKRPCADWNRMLDIPSIVFYILLKAQ